MRIGKTLLAAATALILASTLFSCNLDGGRGVYQAVYQATENSNEKTTAMIGRDGKDGDVVVIQNGDLYKYDRSGHRTTLANLTKSIYLPFFFDGKNIYFAYRYRENNQNYIGFCYEEISSIETDGINEETLKNNKAILEFPDYSNGVTSENQKIVKFESYNYFLDKVMIFYTFEGENDGASADERIKHYGYFNTALSTDETSDVKPDSHTITIHGDIEVPATSVVFGNGIIRSFANDSDIDGIRNGNFVIYTEDGTRYDKNITISTGSVRESDIAMGFDGEHLIFLDGDTADITKNSNRLHNWAGFVNDLIYRQDDIMVPYRVDNGTLAFTVGYLYGEGIYINPDGFEVGFGRNYIGISTDSDIMTTGFIGHKIKDGTYYFLMATKENGFWVLKLDISKSNSGYEYTGTTERYSISTHGPISDFSYENSFAELK